MYTYTGAMEQEQGDLESHGLLSSEPSQRERTCGWQCTAAAFLLGLVLMVTFAAHGDRSLKAEVASKLQLQDDSIWKEVLGHKAYQQYESAVSHTPSTETTTEETATTSLSSSTSSRSPRTNASTSAPTEAPRPGLIVAEATSAPTKAPRSGLIVGKAATSTTTEAPRPGLISASSTTQSSSTTTDAAEQITKLGDVASEFMDEASKLDPKSDEHKSLTNVAHFLDSMMKAKKRITSTSPRPNLPQLTGNVSGMPLHSALAPLESLNDGNKCASDEEEMMGTCYKKCVDLTGGYFPIRTSPFSCCASEPCGLQNSRVHLSFCSGFDVAGDHEGQGCPNFEGACLTDEELFNGLCYKKCSLFADGYTYNHRVAPNLCCRTHGMRCMLPKYFRFSPDYAVGGGVHDGNAQTPSVPHPPMTELTEVSA